MRLSDQRYEELKSEAVRLLEHCHVLVFPIDSKEIINRLGGSLVSYSSLSRKQREACLAFSSDGFSIQENGTWFVVYNDEKGEARTRMTLIHEVAHRWLKHSCESALAESEASFFAKYALAPPIIIDALGLESVSQISSFFGTSWEAANYAQGYWQKWRMFSGKELTEQERKLLQLFERYIDKCKIKEAIAM